VSGEHLLRTDHTVRTWAGRILMLAVAGLLIWVGLYLFGPSWTAHTGGGSHGTFTVTRQGCDSGCQWFGVFAPADGGPARYDVRMGYGHHGINAVGDVVPAIDAGAPNVFPADGGYDWLLAIAALALGAAVLILWCVRLVVFVIRARPALPETSPRS
jgi:hypothetical protein